MEDGFILSGAGDVQLLRRSHLREVEDELLGYCAENDIGVVAYSPMQRGLLTGKFSAERLAGLAPDDHRRKNRDFQEPQFSATMELVEGLKRIAERNGRTCASARIDNALRFVLGLGSVDMVIVGFEHTEQIDDYTGRIEAALSQLQPA